MPKRRDEIKMTDEEIQQFLHTTRRWLQVCTNDRDGWPQASPMGWVVIDNLIHFQGYEKSRKIVNLRRDHRVTVMLEDGKDYSELRGVVIKGTAEIIEDSQFTMMVTKMCARHAYGDGEMIPEPVPAGQTTKRVTVRVRPVAVYSWAHSKLPAGVH